MGIENQENLAAQESEAGISNTNFFCSIDIGTGGVQEYHFDPSQTAEVAEFKHPEILSPEDLTDLQRIENESFPHAPLDMQRMLTELKTSSRSMLFLFREGRQIVGKCYGKPCDQAVKDFDYYGAGLPFADRSPKTLYIQALNGRMKHSFRKSYSILENQGKILGYEKISLHAINPHLARVLGKFGFQTKAIIPDWLGHRAEYMEKNI